MNFALPLAGATALLCCLPPAFSMQGLIHFSNGDVIHGSWVSLGDQNTPGSPVVEMTSPLLKANPHIASAALDFIQWDREPKPPAGNARLVMQNGDTIQGRLVRFDEHAMVVETVFMREWPVSRAALSHLTYNHEGRIIYSGMHSLKGWTTNSANAWEVGDNAFYTREGNANLYRDVDLPAKFHLRIEIAGNRPPQVGIRLWTTPGQEGTHYTAVDLTPFGISIENREGDAVRTLVNTNRKHISLPVRFDLFVDRDTGTYLVYFNEERFEYDPLEEQATGTQQQGYGTGIAFFVPESNLELKNLSIHEWDGMFPGEQIGDKAVRPQTIKSPEEQGLESLLLVNGDRLEGRITPQGDGVEIQSELYRVHVPFRMIATMSLPAANANRPQPAQGMAVRLHLADGSVLTAGVTGKDGESLSLSSPYSPDYTLDLSDVRKVEFIGEDQDGSAAQ